MYKFDTLAWATFGTSTTVCALGVVDNWYVVYQDDCAIWTKTLALSAGNTAYLTSIHNVLTTALTRASNVVLCGNGNALDQGLWTSLDAKTAGLAKVGVYKCFTILNFYCVPNHHGDGWQWRE